MPVMFFKRPRRSYQKLQCQNGLFDWARSVNLLNYMIFICLSVVIILFSFFLYRNAILTKFIKCFWEIVTPSLGVGRLLIRLVIMHQKNKNKHNLSNFFLTTINCSQRSERSK